MSRGFSLIEMLIVMAIAALSIGLATAGYQHLIDEHHLKRGLASIEHQTRSARQYALSAQASVTYCALDESQGVCGNNYQNGFDLFIDENNNGQYESFEPLIWSATAYPKRIKVRANRTSFVFHQSGFSASAGSIEICNSSGTISHVLIISLTASARVQQNSACSF